MEQKIPAVTNNNFFNNSTAFVEGQAVEVRLKGKRRWRDATVTKVYSNGLLDVVYVNGDNDTAILPILVRAIKGSVVLEGDDSNDGSNGSNDSNDGSNDSNDGSNNSTNDTSNFNIRDKEELFNKLVKNTKNSYIDNNITSLKLALSTISSMIHVYTSCMSNMMALLLTGLINNNLFKDMIHNLIIRRLKIREYTGYINSKLDIEGKFQFLKDIKFTGIEEVQEVCNGIYNTCLDERIDELQNENDN
jgi:hypothetical protein